MEWFWFLLYILGAASGLGFGVWLGFTIQDRIELWRWDRRLKKS